MTNRVYHNAESLRLLKSGIVNGQAIAIGGIKGVAAMDGDSNNEFTLMLGRKANVHRINVGGATDDTSVLANGSAVAFGDTLYVNSAGVITKDSSGTVLFGYALGTRNSRGAYDTTATPVASGATSACDILLA